MDELAAVSVRAVGAFMELLAEFGFISGWNMFLFLKLVITMGKSASLSVRTASCGAEGPTKFSLDFDFVVLRHDPSVIFERKWIALLSLISLVTTFKLFATKEFVLVLNLINYAAHLVVKRLLSIRI